MASDVVCTGKISIGNFENTFQTIPIKFKVELLGTEIEQKFSLGGQIWHLVIKLK